VTHTDNQTDHQHLLDSVRSAMETHSEPTEPEQVDVGQEITAEQDQPRQLRDGRGRFMSSSALDEKDAVQIMDAIGGPPTSWSEAARTQWQQLSPEIQQAINKREAEMENGRQHYADERERLRSIDEVIAPRRQYLAQAGFRSDAEALNHLLTFSDGFARNPVGTLQFLAQQFGIRPEQVFGTGPTQQQLEAHISERVQAELAKAEKQRQRVVQKTKAANASLSGAPHGISSAPTAKRNGKGSFGDIADDVRSAIQSLGF
jgi:hypothetical protein